MVQRADYGRCASGHQHLRGHQAGLARVNFNYFIDQPALGYNIEVVQRIASEFEGDALLPFYKFEPTTGMWRHHYADNVPPVMSLARLTTSTVPRDTPTGA